MNCEACGHDFYNHDMNNPGFDRQMKRSLCSVCYLDPHGGPCFPWEFR